MKQTCEQAVSANFDRSLSLDKRERALFLTYKDSIGEVREVMTQCGITMQPFSQEQLHIDGIPPIELLPGIDMQLLIPHKTRINIGVAQFFGHSASDLAGYMNKAAESLAGSEPDDQNHVEGYVTIDTEMADSEGLSVYSILRRIKIPGVVVGSAIDGTVNALMTLRIGYITRTYLQQGEEALTGIQRKRAVKLQAMKDALLTIPAVIASGSVIVGKKTTSLILKIINRKY